MATKHAFQGWADAFLLTPADGVQDVYLGGTLPLFGGTLQARYHDFRAERGSQQYGEEINVAYSHAIPLVKGLVATVKYAGYDADDYSVDTEKLCAAAVQLLIMSGGCSAPALPSRRVAATTER